MASSSSRRVSDGLNAMAFGSVLVSGGVAAGVEVAASAASKIPYSKLQTTASDEVRDHP